jgi:DNA-binding NarL/FixJ family response regulator
MARGRILIADDHPLIHEGLQLAIRARHPGYAVDAAETVAAAERLVNLHRDYVLLLLDYRLPDADGFSGFFRLQHQLGRVPIALISAEDSPRVIAAARALGAAGYLSKRRPLDETAASIGTLLAGGTVFPATDASAEDISSIRDRIDDLSTAQRRVLFALAKGDLNKRIAGDLGVTEATIKAHLSAIFRKLGVSNRTQAILAIRPLIEVGEGQG